MRVVTWLQTDPESELNSTRYPGLVRLVPDQRTETQHLKAAALAKAFMFLFRNLALSD